MLPIFTLFYSFLPKIKTAGKMALFQRVLLNEIALNTILVQVFKHYLSPSFLDSIKYSIFYVNYWFFNNLKECVVVFIAISLKRTRSKSAIFLWSMVKTGKTR